MTDRDLAADALIERQRRHFDGVAEEYRRGREAETHRILKELIWRAALSATPELKGARIRVLEPMCGYAEGRDILERELGAEIIYTGFDYSEEIVSHLRARAPHWDVTHADVTRFKPRQDVYDVVILIGGLHHVPNHAGDVVARMASGLKPGGFFLNFEPTSGNPLFQAVRDAIYRRNRIFDAETERAFSVSELCGFFQDAGLERRAVFYPGLLAYVLYYNPYAFPWLNVGGAGMTRATFAIDKLFYRNVIGRTLSFATLSVWRKPA